MLSAVTVSTQGILALLGYAVVFFGLILLMIVVTLLGKAFSVKKKVEEPVAAVVESVKKADIPLAPGAAGELKLYDTNPKTAAMLMAIVADTMGKPLNELRFISIKEVK